MASTQSNPSGSRSEIVASPVDREVPQFVFALALAVLLTVGALNLQAAGPTSAKAAPSGKYRNVVALTPFAANAMAQMGVFPEAIGQTLGGDRRYVSGLRSTPRIQMSHPNGPNMEQLLTYSPDLIFTAPEWAPGRSAMEGMVGADGRVVDADPKSIRASYRKVDEIARLLGRKARGVRLVRQMKKSVRRSTRNITNRPNVMVILGVGKTPHLFLGDSWGGRIVREAGGRLKTAGKSAGEFAKVSNEAVLAEQPEVIIAVLHANPDEINDELKQELRDQWAGTPAADDGRIFFSDDNSLLQAGTDIGKTIRKVRRLLGTG